MKATIVKGLLFGLMLVLCSSLAHAQTSSTGSVMTQSSQRHDSAGNVASNSTSAQTLTLIPNSGEAVYIYEIDVENCAGASPVAAAAPTTITTTGIQNNNSTNGSTLTITVGSGVAAGLCQPSPPINYPTGLKAQLGTNVTFVMPTFASNQTIRLNVGWRSAP